MIPLSSFKLLVDSMLHKKANQLHLKLNSQFGQISKIGSYLGLEPV